MDIGDIVIEQSSAESSRADTNVYIAIGMVIFVLIVVAVILVILAIFVYRWREKRRQIRLVSNLHAH